MNSHRADLSTSDRVTVGLATAAALGPFLVAGVRETLPGAAGREGPAPQVLRLDLESIAGRAAGPRELRRLPGIGRVRALALARTRWARGGRFALEDWSAVPGIGAVTREGVRAWLARTP